MIVGQFKIVAETMITVKVKHLGDGDMDEGKTQAAVMRALDDLGIDTAPFYNEGSRLVNHDTLEFTFSDRYS